MFEFGIQRRLFLFDDMKTMEEGGHITLSTQRRDKLNIKTIFCTINIIETHHINKIDKSTFYTTDHNSDMLTCIVLKFHC